MIIFFYHTWSDMSSEDYVFWSFVIEQLILGYRNVPKFSDR